MRFYKELFNWGLVNELKPLFLDHHLEITDEGYGPLEPDFTVYENCDKAGVLRIYTARDGGKLIGYQVFMVTKHPHSKNSLQANQDILYLSPTYRKGMIGVNFIKWCTNQLRLENVKYVHQHISAQHDFGVILERLGYRLEDLVYTKKLEAA